jgi:hypothetical protein
MGSQTEGARGVDEKGRGGRDWLTLTQIVVANAIPVVGVWFMNWDPLKPIFFYWLDGLLAVWGLGVVAAVVTSRESPNAFGAPGPKRWLIWFAMIGLLFLILAIPSVVAAMMVFGSLHRDVIEILHDVFKDNGAWFSLAIVILSYAGQTIGELLWKPEQTLKGSGEARANLFIHRSIVMGLLVFWGKYGQPSRWALAAYVLVMAFLFTYTQLFPGRYLKLVGSKIKRPVGKNKPSAKNRRHNQPTNNGR